MATEYEVITSAIKRVLDPKRDEYKEEINSERNVKIVRVFSGYFGFFTDLDFDLTTEQLVDIGAYE